jgi:hypothetical protein
MTGGFVIIVAVYFFFWGSCPKSIGRRKNMNSIVEKILFMKGID